LTTTAVNTAATVLLIVACPRRSQHCIRFRHLQDHCLFSHHRHQYRFCRRRLSFAVFAAIVSTIAAAATASVSATTPQSFLPTPPFPSPLLPLAVCLREQRTVAVDVMVKSV
jgi:hypothetical protein